MKKNKPDTLLNKKRQKISAGFTNLKRQSVMNITVLTIIFVMFGLVGCRGKEFIASNESADRIIDEVARSTHSNKLPLETENPTNKENNNDISFAEDEETETKASETTDSPEAVPGKPGMVFFIGNDFEVFNGGTPPMFNTNEMYIIKELWTYHWNGGKGAKAGTLTLQSSDGTTYGPWQAEQVNKVYWVVKLAFDLPPGNYTVIDSDPSTLAQNKESDGIGHSWMYGEVEK